MGRRVIFHIDVNSAFLSWEAVYRVRFLGECLDLRTIPSAVGGDIAKRRGIILAKSIPAKNTKSRQANRLSVRCANTPNWYWYRHTTHCMRNVPMRLWRY